MSKRVIMRIELSPSAKKKLTDFSKNRGMTQVAVASRLVEWFAKQPDAIQAGVMGQYPSELTPDIAEMILESMKKKSK